MCKAPDSAQNLNFWKNLKVLSNNIHYPWPSPWSWSSSAAPLYEIMEGAAMFLFRPWVEWEADCVVSEFDEVAVGMDAFTVIIVENEQEGG